MNLAFISYSSSDRVLARRVAELIRASGLDVWVDEHALVPGKPVASGLENAIDRADLFVPVLTRSAVASAWVEFELERALTAQATRGLRILPLVFDDCEIPRGFAHMKWGDARTTEGLVRAVNLALSDTSCGLPLPREMMQQRHSNRAPVRHAVRLCPSYALKEPTLLGPAERKYVFVADYAEQCGRSLRQILANIWAGDAYDQVVSSNHAWTAIIFEVGDAHSRKLDILPATWKSMFRIVSDPRRLGLIVRTNEERQQFGTRPPYDYYSDDQSYWYQRLTDAREWRFEEGATQRDGHSHVQQLFGFSWWCYDGSGITQQGPRSSLSTMAVPSRLFLVKNVALALLNVRQQELGIADDGIVLC